MTIFNPRIKYFRTFLISSTNNIVFLDVDGKRENSLIILVQFYEVVMETNQQYWMGTSRFRAVKPSHEVHYGSHETRPRTIR